MQDFTDLVMVPGQFGLTVPLELLIRAWGKRTSWRLPSLFEGTDFFQWFEDAVGNVEVGSRNGLEATLVVQSRLGGAKFEVDYIKRLLLAVRESGTGFGEDREVSFAVDSSALSRIKGIGSFHIFASYLMSCGNFEKVWGSQTRA